MLKFTKEFYWIYKSDQSYRDMAALIFKYLE
jgi:hypothetical protein